MLEHENVWKAIEKIAAENQMTCSGLARFSGLDATTFNRCKRVTSDGKPRWPSMASIAKVLRATGITMREFANYFPEN